MLKQFQISQPRRGTAAVFLAVSFTALLMAAAVPLDMGLMFSEKRHAQAVADAAALAGAADLYTKYSTSGVNAGMDTSGTAAAASLAVANTNGYTNDGTTSVVTVRTGGQNYFTGPNAGSSIPSGRIEVSVTFNHPRYFSLIFGSGTIPIKARAVAEGTWEPAEFGLLALAPTGTGVTAGNGSINVGTGTIHINSNGSTAMDNGPNGVIKAGQIDILGNYAKKGTITTTPTAGNIHTSVPAVPDPLWNLPEPAKPGNGQISAKLSSKDQSALATKLKNAGVMVDSKTDNYYIADPGTYSGGKGGITFKGGPHDLTLFKPGIYYLNNYNLDPSNGGFVMHPDYTGGMMLFLDAGSSVTFNGNGKNPINLTAMTSGPYKNMILFQARSSTATIKLTGNGNFKLKGTIYAANGSIDSKGNGSATDTAGSAVIVKTVALNGNGSLNIDFATGQVAGQRVFRLVE